MPLPCHASGRRFANQPARAISTRGGDAQDMSEADADGDIDRLLGEALDLEPADREGMLQRIGASDGPLRNRLSTLLALAAHDGGFLGRSPLRNASPIGNESLKASLASRLAHTVSSATSAGAGWATCIWPIASKAGSANRSRSSWCARIRARDPSARCRARDPGEPGPSRHRASVQTAAAVLTADRTWR